jgi:hypothetical protein
MAVMFQQRTSVPILHHLLKNHLFYEQSEQTAAQCKHSGLRRVTVAKVAKDCRAPRIPAAALLICSG